MLFQTLEFLLLFFLALVINYISRGKARELGLLLCSYLFYSWFSSTLLILLVISTVVDYSVGRALVKCRRLLTRRLLLSVSVIVNLGLLFFFKYINMAIGSLNGLGILFSSNEQIPYMDVILPLGISFYTFQTLSYTIDIYRKKITEASDLLSFALFVAFFPQLVAGPIVRAIHLIPQLKEGPKLSENGFLNGLLLFVFGLFKKVVVADGLAPMVELVYGAPDSFGSIDIMLATYAFAFQIYCDFSGYTDMAIGIARMMGYELGENFAQPYFSLSIREFWKRWHISLSTWLRDYLYISLGGSRGSPWRGYRNVFITMLLGGLWHGASWNFVFWGGLHGLWIVLERRYEQSSLKVFVGGRIPAYLRRVFSMLFVFHGVCFCWIFFRAVTLSDALSLIGNLFVFRGISDIGALALLWVFPVIAIDLLIRRFSSWKWEDHNYLAWATAWIFLFVSILIGDFRGNDFVYFQF